MRPIIIFSYNVCFPTKRLEINYFLEVIYPRRVGCEPDGSRVYGLPVNSITFPSRSRRQGKILLAWPTRCGRAAYERVTSLLEVVTILTFVCQEPNRRSAVGSEVNKRKERTLAETLGVNEIRCVGSLKTHRFLWRGEVARRKCASPHRAEVECCPRGYTEIITF